MTLEEYKKTHLLDNVRYKIIGAVRQGRSWIIIQASTPPAPQHYCLQYAGNGRYFDTLEDLNKYTRRRWNKVFIFNGGAEHGETETASCE